MKTSIQTLILLVILSLISCEKEDEINTLQVSKKKNEISAEGGSTNFSIETNADSWNIENPAADWLTIPITSGTNNKAVISINVDSKTLISRTGTLTVTAGNAKPAYIIVSQASSEYLYDLSADVNELSFFKAGNKHTFEITSDANVWSINTDADWLEFSTLSGSTGTTKVDVVAFENEGDENRTAVITISTEFAPTFEISVSQKGEIYPSYNINPIEPDMTGMSSNAMELANNIKIGWNIGNTMEAIGGETAWGNPLVTEELIQLVKQNGFNAIRIPCSWNQYMENSSTAKIKISWLDRVKQVVKYCENNDLYVLLNIHWDQGWLEKNCTPDKQKETNAKQKAFWEQIATHLRDFDEHLIFASANEPHVENSAQMDVLLSYHQTFINAVRSTGGKNSYRTLVVQGPSTDIEKTENLMNTMPTDEIAGRLMAEIHYYTPYQFCLMTEDASWGKMFYYWGDGYHSTTNTERNATWGEESALDDLMGRMKSQFVDKGIPVIMGEFAVIRRSSLTGENLDLHLASRTHYLKYLTKQAKSNGILPFYWDAGNMGDNASALFNRQNNTVYDQQALDALMEGVNE